MSDSDNYCDYDPEITCSTTRCPNLGNFCNKCGPCNDIYCSHDQYDPKATSKCGWCKGCVESFLCDWCCRCIHINCSMYSDSAYKYCDSCEDLYCGDEQCQKFIIGKKSKCVECLHTTENELEPMNGPRWMDPSSLPVEGATIPWEHSGIFQEAFSYVIMFMKTLGVWLRGSMVEYTTVRYVENNNLVTGFYSFGGKITISAYGMASIPQAIYIIAHEAIHAFLWRIGVREPSKLLNEGLCEIAGFLACQSYLRGQQQPFSYWDVDNLIPSIPEYKSFRTIMEGYLCKILKKITRKTFRKYLQICRCKKRIVIPLQCFRCGKFGHVVRNCHQKRYRKK